MKKRGFGSGKWNGVGGKVQSGESIEDEAKREMFEEEGLQILNMERRGILEIEFQDNPEILEVHLFKVNAFSGEPEESEEMRPQWFPHEGIPFDLMWQDDRHWFPLFLSDKKFKGRFLFDNGDTMLGKDLVERSDIG
jgi:8-oxo-dGTP diphosphatase/2-hydroxy-dATP diphosphatase